MASCGAKTRAGTPCKRAAMPNGRCKLHGGATPKGQKNALKHGIYAEGLTPEETALWSEVKVSGIEDEIKLCRLRLRRALIAQRKVDQDPRNIANLEGFELAEIKRSEHSGGSEKPDKQANSVTKRSEVVTKRPDYNAVIDRLLGRLAQLVKLQSEIAGGNAGTPLDTAREIQQAISEIDELTDVGPDS